MSRRNASKANAQDIAAEIIRRVTASKANPGEPGTLPHVVRLSKPPTPEERLQLAACRLMNQPVAIVPGKCLTIEDWVERYASLAGAPTADRAPTIG